MILSNFAFQNNNSFFLIRKNYSHCAFATTGSSSNTNQDTFPNQELSLDYVLQNNIIVPVNQTINLIGTKYLTVQEGVVWCVDITFFRKDCVSSIFFIDLSSRLVIYQKTLYQPFNVSDCIVAIQEACLVTNKQPKVVHADFQFNNEHWKLALFHMGISCSFSKSPTHRNQVSERLNRTLKGYLKNILLQRYDIDMTLI